uniref:non-specific serine/threonine protein kinase n=1 Tax=Crassostrea virginica TaxID=6565 RepID=A0A8B8D714_CRAVI|nr:uncharacterized protein LOC111124909 isoform X4 [Crassostrea virginica]
MSKITYDREESILRGQVPLHKFKEKLQELQLDQVEEIDFSDNGYCTDSVIKVILDHKKEKVLQKLSSVNFSGCNLLTDHGMKWLAEVIDGAPLLSINLDSCKKVTDDGLFLLSHKIGVDKDFMVKISVRNTAVRYTRSLKAKVLVGNPIFSGIGDFVHSKTGHVLVVPHHSVKQSLASSLSGGKVTSCEGLHHYPLVKFEEDWELNINEVSINNPMFDVLARSNPVQVVIPFDASATPTEVTSHVKDTITRIAMRERENPKILSHKRETFNVDFDSADCFMDKKVVFGHVFDMETGILQNKLADSSRQNLGYYFSRQPFSKSYPYFEVELVEYAGDLEAQKKDVTEDDQTWHGVLLGCLHEQTFIMRNTESLQKDQIADAQGFRFKKIGDRFGFGIQGEWNSEYMAGPNCSFYTVTNGVESTDKSKLKDVLTTRNYYPMVSIVSTTLAKVKILHYSAPPKEFLSVMKAENRWISPGYLFNMVVNRNGLISTCAFSNRSEDSHYISETSVGTLDTPHTSFTVKIEDAGSANKVVFGIGSENHKFGDSQNYIAFICMDGSVKIGPTEVPLEIKSGAAAKEEEITFKWYIEKQDENFNGTKECKTEIFRNGQLYCQCQFAYSFIGGLPQNKVIGKFVTGAVRKIRLLQHLPIYRPPGVLRDQITLGYLRRVIVDDDGNMKCGDQHGINTFGIFVAKTQFNSSLTYFEMEVIACPSRVTIGVAHYDKPPGFYLGMNQCEVGLHNTSELSQVALGTKKQEREYAVGDIVGCGVEGAYDDDGYLVQEQDIEVYFTRNGERIETTTLKYVSDGLYPSIMVEKPGCHVRVLNYYSETKQHKESVLTQSKELKKAATEEKVEEKIPFFGPQYTVVGMESGLSDAAGKIQILKSKVALEDLGSSAEVQRIVDKKNELEKNFSNLTLEEQLYYAQLCVAEEKLKNLQVTPGRLNFITADTNSDKGLVELKNIIQNTFKAHSSHQLPKYYVNKAITVLCEKVRDCMSKTKLVPWVMSHSQNLVDEVSKIFEGTLSGTQLVHIFDLLHDQGAYMMLKTPKFSLSIDIGYAAEMIQRLEKFAATESMSKGKITSAIGQNSHVWTQDSLLSKIIQEKEPSKAVQIQDFLESYLGLIKIPVWRESETDEQYLYSTTANLSAPPVKLRDFWSKGEATKNYVIIQKTYSFLHELPEYLISLVLAATSRYGRLIAMTSDGAVFQVGAVQTTIIQHTGILDKKVLSVESKCYMPDKKTDLLNELTESYAWDYTFRVMCLYTDFIDRIIQSQGLVPLITHNYPTGQVKVSFGCIHNWSTSSSVQHVQSVCTLCNRCCEKGDNCTWNGIMGTHLRECGCKTQHSGCSDCGICVTCARDMWKLNCELRPMPLQYNKIRDLPPIDMNPVTFDEIEVTIQGGACPPICLRDMQKGEVILAAPGKASSLNDGEAEKLKEKIEVLMKDNKVQWRTSDKVKIRISDPLGAVKVIKGETIQKTAQKFTYFAIQCREVTLFQESGILCYNSFSTAMPVGQLIGPKPFSSSFRSFSFKILDEGRDKAITIGIAPSFYEANRQPGWNRNSFAYHADDGGIFLESGYSRFKKEVCFKGDIMSVDFDVDTRIVRFFKNKTEVYSHTVNANPRGGFHPMIGLHSPGECVKLMEVHPWIPDSADKEKAIKPTTFETKNLGNILINPARSVMLTKYGTKGYFGSVVLYNPTSSRIGIKILSTMVNTKNATVTTINEEEYVTAIIEPKEGFPLSVHTKVEDIKDIDILWTSLDKTKDYSPTDIINMEKFSEHKLSCEVSMASNISDTVPLRVCVADEKPEEGMYRMQIFKNAILIEEYWIPAENYRLEIPFSSGSYSIAAPKCPSFLYPGKLQRGMKLLVTHDNNDTQLVEALITEIYEGGGYCLEYTPDGAEQNEVLCYDADMLEVSEEKYDPEQKILLYKSDSDMTFLTRTFVSAPPYLISEGGGKILNQIDADWKDEALRTFSACFQDIKRHTVQEQHITYNAHTLSNWLTGYGSSGHVDDSFAFLPRQLDANMLLYPSVTNMFEDLAIHRLCFFVDLLHHFQPQKKVDLNNPVHFMDMAGIIPRSPPPIDLTFCCNFQGWIYLALIAQKLLLPSYTMWFTKQQLTTEEMGELDRKRIEKLLFEMVSMYASLCSIYASQHGGLPNQQNPVYGSDKVVKLLGDGDTPPVNYSVKTMKEIHKLIRQGRKRTCKAHIHAIVKNEILPEENFEIKYEMFDPYNELINAFEWDVPTLPSIPSVFFQKFPNLQYFSLESGKLEENKVVPLGASKLLQLETIKFQNVDIQALPKDIFQVPELRTMYLINVPLKGIEVDLPHSTKLKKLVIQGLRFTAVPKQICILKELEELYIDYNPITTLPNEILQLTLLRILSVKGIPLISFEGTKDSITKDQYFGWHEQHPMITNYISKEGVTKLFEEFDQNKNSALEMKELAQLNLKLFFTIPRFGVVGTNLKSGGVPPVIFQLKSLQELYLDNQGIQSIPADIENLSNLRVLSLTRCLMLQSIAAATGLLPNIKNMNLHSCPSLRTPPLEVVGRGFESVKAYLKRLHGGFTECRRTKLMFVGLGEAGKTSLLQALMSSSKKTAGTQNAQLTDGIDIKTWTVKSENGLDITFSAWDFAGQTVYYNTHQFFMSKRAVYMLLWNMRMGFEHAGLDFWLSSIACHAPDTPILVIGTQSDQVPKQEIPEKDLKARYPQIQSFHYVSSLTGSMIPELQKELLSVTLSQSYMGEKIPQVWLNLEKQILGERTKKSILDYSVIEDFAMEHGIFDEKDVKQAIKFLDDLGTVQYFDNDFLRDKVVINPQWIVNVMACVVSVKQSPIQKHDGRFLHEHIKDVWNQYSENLHNWLLSLTEEFDLTFPLPGKPINIVPCLLPLEPPNELEWPEADLEHGIRENKMLYKFAYLPAGLFNRAQVRLFNFSDGKIIWKNGSFLKKNKHLALIKQENDSELVVLVQGPRPENILLLVHEVFESLILESFHGVIYDYFVPCPDCISKEGTKDPCLFKAELIRRAKDLKAPFLQCTKYFHTVSMGQLLAMMPEDKDSDFDIHLQHSISALQSINNAMQFDVVVLYCSDDIPSKTNPGVDPFKIRDELKNWGFSVFMHEDLETAKIEELTLAIKNCKVVVCCVSDQFEQDQKCRDMFLYIKEQLFKKFAIAVIRESMEWKSSELGMKIGQPKMCMLKTPDRFTQKICDLKDIVEDHIAGLDLMKPDHPDIFISYCWQNSQDAVNNGTQARHGALGYGDPRKIKEYLEKKGLSCWLDIEQMGKYGLYQEIAIGLQNCKVCVAFVSDEYVESDACMMELRFAVCNMNLPLVVVVVGTGDKWKRSEISLLMRRSDKGASKVYMQKENPEGLEVLYKFVVDALPSLNDDLLAEEKKKKDMKKKKKEESTEKKATNEKHSYQEEYELIQRKFMRHVITMTKQLDLQLLPRLFVFDFVRSVNKSKGPELLQSSSERPKTASKQAILTRTSNLNKDRVKAMLMADQVDDEEEWQTEDFCIRLLCEHEEGWHLVSKPLSLFTFTVEEVISAITEAAPFLARFYAILKQSSVKLKCLNGKLGESFMNFLDHFQKNLPVEGKSTSNFLKAYMAVHKIVASHLENEEFVRQLDRCHLPSGKIAWLCEKHSKGNRITKLGVGSISVHGQGQTILNKEDELIKEYLKTSTQASALMSMPNREFSSMSLKREPSVARKQEVKADKMKVKSDQNKEDKAGRKKGENAAKENPLAKQNGTENANVKTTKIDSVPQSPTSSTTSSTSTSLSQVAGTVRRLQRNYSKSGRQKSQACVLQ